MRQCLMMRPQSSSVRYKQDIKVGTLQISISNIKMMTIYKSYIKEMIYYEFFFSITATQAFRLAFLKCLQQGIHKKTTKSFAKEVDFAS
jgi:hypothetical protein